MDFAQNIKGKIPIQCNVPLLFFLGTTINLLDIHSQISDTINQLETCPSASEEIKLKQM